jgi:hypothetical protein
MKRLLLFSSPTEAVKQQYRKARSYEVKALTDDEFLVIER